MKYLDKLKIRIKDCFITEAKTSKAEYVSIRNLKLWFKSLSISQNAVAKASAELDAMIKRGDQFNYYQSPSPTIDSHSKKIIAAIKTIIDIHDELLKVGKINKSLQLVYIDALEDNIESLEARLASGSDSNNYVIKSQIKDRKADLAKAKADLKDLPTTVAEDLDESFRFEADIDTHFDSSIDKDKWLKALKKQGINAKFSGASTLVSGPKKELAKFLSSHYDSEKEAKAIHPDIFENTAVADIQTFEVPLASHPHRRRRRHFDEAVSKIACVMCDAVNTEAAWKKNNGFCPACKKSSQGVAEGVISTVATGAAVVAGAAGVGAYKAVKAGVNAIKSRVTVKGKLDRARAKLAKEREHDKNVADLKRTQAALKARHDAKKRAINAKS